MSKTNETQTAQATQTAKPQKAKKVKLFIPRGASNEDPNFFISVNGVNYLLPKGKESEVPAHIAEEYYRCMKAQARADDNKVRMAGK